MNSRRLLRGFLAWIALAVASCYADSAPSPQIALIPRPVNCTLQDGHFDLGPATTVGIATGADEAKDAAAFLREWMTYATSGNRLLDAPVAENGGGAVIFTKGGAKARWGEEGYGLEITAKRVLIRANSAAGFFYGAETL